MRRARPLAAAASALLASCVLAWALGRALATGGEGVTAAASTADDVAGNDVAPTTLAAAPDLAPGSGVLPVPRPTVDAAGAATIVAGTLVEPDDEVLECACGLEGCPSHVEFVDAITGLEVTVGSNLTEDPLRQVHVPEPFWGRVGRRVSQTSGALGDRVLRASEMTLPLAVPSPYLAWRGFDPATMSDRANSFHTVVPLDHEVDVRLRILDDEARSDTEAVIAYWSVADALVAKPAVARSSDGSVRLLGVPWLPGESFQLGFRSHAPPRPPAAASDARVADASATAEPVDDARIFAMTIPMPDSPHEPIVRDVQPAWEAPPNVFKGRGGHRNLRAVCGCSGCREAPTDLGDVRLRFLDAGRRPIRDLRVRVASTTMLTDADGVVGLRKVLDRSHVEVVDVGYRFEGEVIFVDPDREVVRELVEAPAGTLEVSVVDASGRAVPSATISVEPESFGWFDVDAQGVQRLDPFTDVTGRRTCHDVPAGEATVRASYGRRRGEAKVVVVANAPSVVRITVK